ncbi:MAG: hypothetical protein AAB791_00970, partial [Patescibacteria group bacterium]
MTINHGWLKAEEAIMNKVWFKKVFPDAILPRRASTRAVGYDVFAYNVSYLRAISLGFSPLLQ